MVVVFRRVKIFKYQFKSVPKSGYKNKNSTDVGVGNTFLVEYDFDGECNEFESNNKSFLLVLMFKISKFYVTILYHTILVPE